MSSFRERKEQRTKHYLQNEFGRKMITCTACSGSGVYDSYGSPPCGACGGVGKVKEWRKYAIE